MAISWFSELTRRHQMPNSIKRSGKYSVALQVTKPARAAGLVEENEEGEACRLAEVRLFSFDGLLLVVDLEEVSTEDIAELVGVATRDTKSIYRAKDASLQRAGNGYLVQLPVADDAGFHLGESTPCSHEDGILLITKKEAENIVQLAKDLLTIRQEQYRNDTKSSG